MANKGKLDRYDRAFIKRVLSYPLVRSLREFTYSYGDNYLSEIWVYYENGYEVYRCDQITAYRILLEL